jgi:hypothetical protein
MRRLLRQAEQVLRGPQAAQIPGQTWSGIATLAGLTVAGGFLYGGVMGSFGGVSGDRIGQVLISGLKVPFLLLTTFSISVPSFFVLNTLLGVREDFPAVMRVLLAGQAGLTIILTALAPYTLLWYASSADYQLAVLFNTLMFALASFVAQWMLRGWYRPLVARTPRHRWLLRAWFLLYAFVGIQMAWILRPFVGWPGSPVEFFRAESWGNAYVVVGRMVWDAATHVARP